MVFAEDIRRVILKLAEQRGRLKSFQASEVAQSVDPDNWKDVLEQVRLVASALIKEGKIRPTSNSPSSKRLITSSDTFIKN